tara:strand:- start:189 stop:1349 length:1161 start_codon:yes stop_codon:yes gene_type:complete
MSNGVTTQIVQENPQIEAYRLGLLADVQDLVRQRIAQGTEALPPPVQVAGLSDLEKSAIALGQQGVGAFQPFLQGATGQVLAGQQALRDFALPTLQQGQATLAEAQRLAQQTRDVPFEFQGAAGDLLLGSTGTFDPSINVDQFMNPYTQEVIDQTLEDIARQGELQQLAQDAQAVSSGAFGGSRQGIMDARLAGNILREQARAGGQLRAQGFESARQAAQQAFEQSQARRQAAGQGIGQLGLNFGQLAQQDVGQLQNIGMGLGSLGTAAGGLGTQISSLGVQQAGLGELAQALGRQDISTLTGLGGLQRQNQQQALDALRQTRTEQLAQPFQQLGFLSDIYRGTPSSQSTVTSQAVQPPSTAQQVLGYGIAGLGALTGARQGNLLP